MCEVNKWVKREQEDKQAAKSQLAAEDTVTVADISRVFGFAPSLDEAGHSSKMALVISSASSITAIIAVASVREHKREIPDPVAHLTVRKERQHGELNLWEVL
jgi:hypothetical protein